MATRTLTILQHMLKDFQSVSNHFGSLCIKAIFVHTKILNFSDIIHKKHNTINMLSHGYVIKQIWKIRQTL